MLVQGDVPDDWRYSLRRVPETLRRLVELTTQVPPLPEPDLVVWPENAVSVLIDDQGGILAGFSTAWALLEPAVADSALPCRALPPPASPRQQPVCTRARDQRRQSLQQRTRLEADGPRPIAPRAAQPQQHPALGGQLQGLLRHRRAQDVAAEMLEPAARRARLLRLAASEPYRPIVEALCTHAGVGPLSAIRFVLEIGDIHRFARADSIAHYPGLTPSEYSSGDSVQRGAILKCGPGALRAAMLQCGWASVRRGGEAVLREMFERLAPRAGRKRAIVAVTRRLVVRLRARWLEALEEQAVAA